MKFLLYKDGIKLIFKNNKLYYEDINGDRSCFNNDLCIKDKIRLIKIRRLYTEYKSGANGLKNLLLSP